MDNKTQLQSIFDSIQKCVRNVSSKGYYLFETDKGEIIKVNIDGLGFSLWSKQNNSYVGMGSYSKTKQNFDIINIFWLRLFNKQCFSSYIEYCS